MKFTIAIPAYKAAYLQEAIESCLNQTFPDFEVLIVDDASPEDLGSVVKKFPDSRIRYYRNEANCGAVDVVDNWNICLSYAQGEYVICMGDDDRLMPHCLAEYMKLMEKYPELAVYHAMTELIDETSQFVTLQQPRPEYETALSLAWNRWNGRYRQYIGDFCFDVQVLRRDGGFYKLPLAWASDDITAVRAALHGGIANTQIPCFQYRANRQTISRTGNPRLKMEAALKEKEWYAGFIEIQKKNVVLSELDKKYLLCMETEYEAHFKWKYKFTITDGLSGNSLAECVNLLRCGKKVGLKAFDLAKCCAKAVAKRFFRASGNERNY